MELNLNTIIKDLENKKSNFDLGGVELTEEDANLVIKKVNSGIAYEAALNDVLAGISECLEDNEIDLSDKLEMYNGSYNKRTLKKEGLCIVIWPESQDLFCKPNFWEHAWLINDPYGLNRFGSSAYVVEESWFNN